MPRLRHTSVTAVPASACRNAYATCTSVNRDLFIASYSFNKGAKRRLYSSLKPLQFLGMTSIKAPAPKERPRHRRRYHHGVPAASAPHVHELLGKNFVWLLMVHSLKCWSFLNQDNSRVLTPLPKPVTPAMGVDCRTAYSVFW